MFMRPPADAALHTRLDQAFLKADPAATVEALRAQVELATRLQLRSLCVPPLLAGTVKKHNPQLRVSTVVAYPLGLESASCKYFSIEELMEQGIDEFDVVLDLFALVNGNMAKLAAEAGKLGTLCRRQQRMLKVIIETPILNEARITEVVHVLRDAPVDCVKTSTGYGRDATKVEHVELIRRELGDDRLVKCSGGVRSREDALRMVDAGADIIGTSSAEAILAS
ncbi:deoxyribose-phosphate aldolase [bacterium]|nr:deoxyribose-phosphate aldolase [bacterium]